MRHRVAYFHSPSKQKIPFVDIYPASHFRICSLPDDTVKGKDSSDVNLNLSLYLLLILETDARFFFLSRDGTILKIFFLRFE